jgi:aspartate racemase
MKTVGIIGGMGPKATVDFLQKVISLTPAKKDQGHLKMTIAMNPQIPDRTEAILNKLDSPLPELTKSAKLLEESGVSFIVIPCVTAHVWLKEIQESIGVPIISLLDVTLNRVSKKGASIKNIGILTTTGTIQAKIFDNLFNPEGYTIIYPQEEIQDRFLMEGIYRIKAGNDPQESRRHFLRASEDLTKKGAQIIIAACTEIPLSITQADIAVPLIDVNHLLAEVTVQTALSKSQ